MGQKGKGRKTTERQSKLYLFPSASSPAHHTTSSVDLRTRAEDRSQRHAKPRNPATVSRRLPARTDSLGQPRTAAGLWLAGKREVGKGGEKANPPVGKAPSSYYPLSPHVATDLLRSRRGSLAAKVRTSQIAAYPLAPITFVLFFFSFSFFFFSPLVTSRLPKSPTSILDDVLSGLTIS